MRKLDQGKLALAGAHHDGQSSGLPGHEVPVLSADVFALDAHEPLEAMVKLCLDRAEGNPFLGLRLAAVEALKLSVELGPGLITIS